MCLNSILQEVAKDLYIRSLKVLPEDVKLALEKAYQEEEDSSIGKNVLSTILENLSVAEKENNLVCQDTGLAVYFVEVGTNFSLNLSQIQEAIIEGCKRATLEYPLRSNTLHTISRKRTFTNTGKFIPVIHFDVLPEKKDSCRITILPKGSGSENMSFLKMFTPADGVSAVKRFIVDSVITAGANPCPPTVVGVGLGGTSDLCMLLAKKALLRQIGSRNPDPIIAQMEEELLSVINQLGIGPMGLGGKTTALAVNIENADTHITLNPVAVNFQCWAARKASAVIYNKGKADFF